MTDMQLKRLMQMLEAQYRYNKVNRLEPWHFYKGLKPWLQFIKEGPDEKER